MPETPKLIYWDSNTFLSYVNELPDRMPVLDVLLEESSKVGGEVKIYTSTLSQVEVAFGASEQTRQVLDPQIEQMINALWADPEAVVPVEYHAGIGRIARSLIRNAVSRGWSLKPLDAIHLSTALWLLDSGLALDEFHTYDNALMKYEFQSISESANRTLRNPGWSRRNIPLPCLFPSLVRVIFP